LKLVPVKSGEKWGYINQKGEYIISPQFAYANLFNENLAKVVSLEGKTGFIDNKGEFKIPAEFKSATNFSEGLAFVVPDGGYPTCIDKSGEEKFKLKEARTVFAFSEGLAMFVTTDMKFGFVDKTGTVVISPQFEDALPFSEGLAAVSQNGRYGFIDKNGKTVINLQFDYVMPFSEGKAAFVNANQWGFIDKKGNCVIKPQFDYVMPFSEGMAFVFSGKKLGYITENGNIEIDIQADYADKFSSGLAFIVQNNKCGFIDKAGNVVIEPQFSNVLWFFGDIAFVQNGDKWGIINKKGKYIVEPQFDNIITDRSTLQMLQTSHLMGVSLDFVISDYYDATEFINKFFEIAGDNSFDGFTAASTLQSIIGHAMYGDSLKGNEQDIAFSYNTQKMTDAISIDRTAFLFTEPIYGNVTTYSYWKDRMGASKKYSLVKNIAAIGYHFKLLGDARDKGGAIAKALKTEIERRYNVEMKTEKGQYNIYQENKLSFAITYNNYSLTLYILFDKETLQNLLIGIEEEFPEITEYEFPEVSEIAEDEPL
jgi:hypothetical protein